MSVFQHGPAGYQQLVPIRRMGVTRDSQPAISARALLISLWKRYASDYVTDAGIAMNAVHEHTNFAVVKGSKCITALQPVLRSSLARSGRVPREIASTSGGRRSGSKPIQQEVNHGTA